MRELVAGNLVLVFFYLSHWNKHLHFQYHIGFSHDILCLSLNLRFKVKIPTLHNKEIQKSFNVIFQAIPEMFSVCYFYKCDNA